MPVIDENKERTLAWILLEPLAHQGMQPVEALAHVTGLERQEDF